MKLISSLKIKILSLKNNKDKAKKSPIYIYWYIWDSEIKVYDDLKRAGVLFDYDYWMAADLSFLEIFKFLINPWAKSKFVDGYGEKDNV